MLFSLIASLILTQIFAPSMANFSQDVALKQALQGPELAVVQGPIRINEANVGPKISSQSAVVIDQASRKILYASQLHDRRPIASISKLMAALVFLEQNPDLTDEFTLNGTDVAGAGVQHIDRGETVTLKDLLFTALVASDNNAAQSLIRASGLSEEQFIERMNSKALEIGMLNSNFMEPTGLYYANISSAQDVALLLEAALKNDLIADIISRKSYEFISLSGSAGYEGGKAHKVFNTNKLLGSYLNVIGGKTGYNTEGQYNLTSAIKGEQGQVLLIVSLGSDNQDARFYDVKAMAAWALRNYIWPQ